MDQPIVRLSLDVPQLRLVLGTLQVALHRLDLPPTVRPAVAAFDQQGLAALADQDTPQPATTTEQRRRMLSGIIQAMSDEAAWALWAVTWALQQQGDENETCKIPDGSW